MFGPDKHLWRRSFLSWRVLLSALLLSTLARHPLTIANALELWGAYGSALGLTLMWGGLAVFLLCDLTYALLTNFRFQYLKAQYEKKERPEFADTHPSKATWIRRLSWMNILKFPFRGIAVAFGIALLIIGGSEEMTSAILYSSVVVGAFVGLVFSALNERTQQKREDKLEELKKDELDNLNNSQKLSYEEKPSIYWRALNGWELLVAAVLCGNLGRRSLVFPMITHKESLLFGSSFFEIILPFLILGFALDMIHTYANNFKKEYALDQQRAINSGENLPSFDAKYPWMCATESGLSFMNHLRVSFRFVTVVICILMTAGMFGDVIINAALADIDSFDDETVQAMRAVVFAGTLGFALNYMAERDESIQKKEVDVARETYKQGANKVNEPNSLSENNSNNNSVHQNKNHIVANDLKNPNTQNKNDSSDPLSCVRGSRNDLSQSPS